MKSASQTSRLFLSGDQGTAATVGLLKTSLILLGVRVTGILLQAFVVLHLARTLPTNHMGVFAVAYAFLGLMRMLGPIGTDQVAMRRIAQATSAQDLSPLAQRISNDAFTLVVCANAAFAGICALLLLTLMALGFLTVDAVVIAPICTAMPAFAITGLFVGQIRGLGYNITAQVPDAVGLHLVFGGLLLALTWQNALTLQSAMICLSIASWCVVILQVWIRLWIGVDWSMRPSRGSLVSIAREGWDTLQALALTALSVRAPMFLAMILLGPAAAAILEIAVRFGNVCSILTGSVAATLSPRFAKLWQSGERRDITRFLGYGGLMAGIPAFIYVIVLAIAAPGLISLVLPADYRAAHLPMLLVAFATSVNASLGLSSNALLMAGRPRPVTLFSLLSLVAIVFGSLFLAPSFGVTGIAGAMLLGSLLRDGGLTLMMRGRASSVDQSSKLYS